MSYVLPAIEPRSRRRVIAKNVVLTVASQILGFGSHLLLVPAFLASWGESLYGDWLALAAASAYLAMADLGMHVYVINLLTRLHVQHEAQSFREVLQSAVLVYFVLGCVCSTLLVASACLPWSEWFSGHSMDANSARAVALVLGFSAIVSIWSGFVGLLHQVHGAPHRFTGITTLLRASTLLVTLALLLMRCAPTTLASAQLAVVVLFMLGSVIDVRRRTHVPLLSLRWANWSRAKYLVGCSAPFAMFLLASAFAVHGTVLVASSMLGPVAVTTYATSRTLANVIRQGTNTLGVVAWPEFTRLDAGGYHQEAAHAYRLLIKGCSTLSAWLGTFLWFEGEVLYGLWTRGAATLDTTLLHYLLLHVVVHTPAAVTLIYLAATNRHKQLATLSLLQGVCVVGLAAIFCRTYGASGLGLALLLGEVPLAIALIPRWLEQAGGRDASRSFRATYLGLLGITGLLVAAAALCAAHTPAGYSRLATVFLGTLVTALVGGALWLTPAERGLAFAATLREGRG